MPNTRPLYLRTHRFVGFEAGPSLIVLGAVHGNETCGTQAIRRLLAQFDAGELTLKRGSVTFVPVTNPLAYDLKQRMGDRNLNRKLQPNTMPQDYEDHIANALCPLLVQHDVLLDLHSFHTGGQPFAMLGPLDNDGPLEAFKHAAAEERFVAHLGPRRVVEGWLDTYALGVKRRVEQLEADRVSGNTSVANNITTDPAYGVGTTEYLRSKGGYAVTLECGQHEDAQAPEVAYKAIMQTLKLLGLIDGEPEAPAGDFEVLRLVDVTDREHENDQFAQAWKSFDPVKAGDLIGTRASGQAVHAPRDGFIVFPNPKALPGNEWFYFAHRSQRQLRY